MKTKILAINGSPRKGGTQFALEYAMKAAEEIEGVETEIFNLRGKELNFCVHCNRCLPEDVFHCPAFDDVMTKIYPKILEADGIIIGSPVYDMTPSAQTITFVNRLRPLGKMISKGGFGLKVAGGIAVGGARNGGQETTLETICNLMLANGLSVVSGGVFAYNGGTVWSKGVKGEGTKDDEVGLETVKIIGRRVATMAKLIKLGAMNSDMPAYQYAGFISEEEIVERTKAFRDGTK